MRGLAGFAGTIAGVAMLGLTAPASADPPPYPDISRYAKVDFEGYQIADKPGVWFSTPFGLDCGIWDDGSFGCTGAVPESPAGTNQVGWFTGDASAHFDNTDQPRFSSGQAQRVLAANNYLEYSGATCATTPDNAVYCYYNRYGNAGGARFMVSATESWLGSGS